ncbi:hypothetical protein GCM10009639_24070 [Kitasatospora putterlickiae]|uniref:Uncharacterized protein n=1 Tax=Kitasatospora putterlickiae TaxID=221725 RepID=A0ABN1XXV6_9ACTN
MPVETIAHHLVDGFVTHFQATGVTSGPTRPLSRPRARRPSSGRGADEPVGLPADRRKGGGAAVRRVVPSSRDTRDRNAPRPGRECGPDSGRRPRRSGQRAADGGSHARSAHRAAASDRPQGTPS